MESVMKQEKKQQERGVVENTNVYGAQILAESFLEILIH